MEALPSSHALVRFGPFELDQHAGGLCKDGERIRLQQQPLQILRTLLENPGQIITREELRQKIWPSDTFVDFDHGINNAIMRLREALGDTAETPLYIETLPRRGYRFIGNPEVTVPAAVRRIQSLAVLPLENLSRNPEQEYFAEGLTEALITTLGKIGELRVISRTSVMQYQGVQPDLRYSQQEIDIPQPNIPSLHVLTPSNNKGGNTREGKMLRLMSSERVGIGGQVAGQAQEISVERCPTPQQFSLGV